MVSKPDLADRLKNISEKDRQQIKAAEEMLGPDPRSLGFIKNLFWGRFQGDLVLPYPAPSEEETARCDELLGKLDAYLQHDHPRIQIDQEQEIPETAIRKLFDLGVMGMIIPTKYGGGEFGITSYNRVLQRIGETCPSTAVLVSAHQSIGCGALTQFGSSEQKERFLPRMATDTLSAFCLSEPNVGCDAGGQETLIEKSECGEYFTIVSGEKKWATSAAMSGLFTVMGRQRMTDPATGKEHHQITALICTPDMEGVKITCRNRSKVCIRGTWQARIRLDHVRVPAANLLHKEGQGLRVALSCLNIGRCTLSAGMVGTMKSALAQGAKWARYRYQFKRALCEFDLVKEKIARMSALAYAADAMLYYTTGMIDRGDEDIMLETAACKVFCSEFGFQAADDTLQIMGGEGFMTENEIERLWRDSRINTVVEGANEVMHCFIFAYGSKQLGEYLLDIRGRPWKSPLAAIRIALQVFLDIRPPRPRVSGMDASLQKHAKRIATQVREFSHQVRRMMKTHAEHLITNQMVQRRLSWAVIWIHAMSCAMSRLDASLRKGPGEGNLAHDRDTVGYLFDLAEREIGNNLRALYGHDDESMRSACDSALRQVDTLPNAGYSIPEQTPDTDARGTGRAFDQSHIPQFGEGTMFTGDPIQD